MNASAPRSSDPSSPAPPSPFVAWAERASSTPWLNIPAQWIGRVRGTTLQAASDRAMRSLGHPAHPMLTDLPIGSWTSATVLDVVGGRRSATAARRLVAFGVITAVPAIASGLGDAASLEPDRRRAAALHAATNSLATVAYAVSWWYRRRGHRLRGMFVGFLGAGVASVGGYLGGHLAFGRPSDEQTVEPSAPADDGVRLGQIDVSTTLIDVGV